MFLVHIDWVRSLKILYFRIQFITHSGSEEYSYQYIDAIHDAEDTKLVVVLIRYPYHPKCQFIARPASKEYSYQYIDTNYNVEDTKLVDSLCKKIMGIY